MSDVTSTVSTTFPEGYGDLALRSSDGILCYFPKLILSYTSIVFRDMFTLGGDTTDSLSQPLQLTEPNITVEVFLTHLDPNILTPNMDPGTVEGLMLMAHKYQTNVIVHWFEQEVLVRRAATAKSQMQEPLLSTHPTLTLSLCIKLDLDRIGKMALILMVECSSRDMTAALPLLPPSVYALICQHRETRIRRYNGWIERLTGDIPSNRPVAFVVRWSGGRHIPPAPTQVTWSCANCSSRRAKWIFEMAKAVQDKPVWSNFVKAYDDDQGSCCVSWIEEFQAEVGGWHAIAKKEEAVVPTGIF